MTKETKKAYKKMLRKVLRNLNEDTLFDLMIDLDMDRDIGGRELYVAENCRLCTRASCDGCQHDKI